MDRRRTEGPLRSRGPSYSIRLVRGRTCLASSISFPTQSYNPTPTPPDLVAQEGGPSIYFMISSNKQPRDPVEAVMDPPSLENLFGVDVHLVDKRHEIPTLGPSDFLGLPKESTDDRPIPPSTFLSSHPSFAHSLFIPTSPKIVFGRINVSVGT
ncbi:hypothetical protein IE53DRAFT_388993 [Violaceomyces palustris]|uniref:Uncharacterized protein n=1 Tax=Violaceomyces palustris TaxID=1673888 RepID=A0ACD0NSI8_9BASI|nr:hypothetical protein IE53DRAFT_388993 [Violaceomyces palustris]